MRVKLIFLFPRNDDICNIENFKKIIFPINLREISKISDLKNEINKFIRNKLREDQTKYFVENLYLESFLLMDEFEVGLVINNDDEIRAVLEIQSSPNKNIHSAKDKKLKRKKSIKLSNQSSKKKKINFVDVDSDSEIVDVFNLPEKKKVNKKEIKKNKNVTIFQPDSDSESQSEISVSSGQNGSEISVKRKRSSVPVEKKIEYNFPLDKTKYNKPNITNFSNTNNSYQKNNITQNKKEVTNINSFDRNNNFKNRQNKNYSEKNKFEESYTFKNQNYSKQNFIKQAEKLDISILEKSYDLIPSDKVEDLEFLKNHYPTLFLPCTSIIFRIYELSMETGGPAASGYKKGTVDQYIEDYKSFIIKLQNNFQDDPSLLEVYGNIEDEYASNVITVNLRDFIELRLLKSELNNPVHEKKEVKEILTIQKSEEKVIQENSITGYEKSITSNCDSSVKIQTQNEKKIESSKPAPKMNIFSKIVLPSIRRQVEFYFCDKNYYKDSFLLEKAALNAENWIDLDIIMGFNKLRSLTNSKEDIKSALKDSNFVEFNSDGTKIRKKNIVKEFLNK